MFNQLFSTFEFKDNIDKTKLEAMLKLYLSDLPENFYKTQFDLANDYPQTNYQDWVRFLQHPPLKNWVSQQLNVIVEANTNKALGKDDVKDKDAINILRMRKEVIETDNASQKPTIIVIPESLFMKDESNDSE